MGYTSMTENTFKEITGYYPEELLGDKANWEAYLKDLDEDTGKTVLLEELSKSLGITL